MVGPFMQGVLLMGVIYWYSKGMFNMINEYYRSEFQKQLETNSPNKKHVAVDEIEVLLKKSTEESYDSFLGFDGLPNEICPVSHEPDVCFNEKELQKFLGLTMFICFDNNSKPFQDQIEKCSKDCQRAEFAQMGKVRT